LPLGHVAKIKCANISYAKKKLCEDFPIYSMSNLLCVSSDCVELEVGMKYGWQ